MNSAIFQLPDCPICFQPLSQNLVLLRCQHIFHSNCHSALLKSHNLSCPICKAETVKKKHFKLRFEAKKLSDGFPEELDNFIENCQKDLKGAQNEILNLKNKEKENEHRLEQYAKQATRWDQDKAKLEAKIARLDKTIEELALQKSMFKKFQGNRMVQHYQDLNFIIKSLRRQNQRLVNKLKRNRDRTQSLDRNSSQKQRHERAITFLFESRVLPRTKTFPQKRRAL